MTNNQGSLTTKRSWWARMKGNLTAYYMPVKYASFTYILIFTSVTIFVR